MMNSLYEGKRILVTGGAGSIGSSLVHRLLSCNPKVIRVLDNNETGLFQLKEKLASDKIRLLVGDVRDKDRLLYAVEDIDIIFHAAALKHVPLCDFNPFEAIKTNVEGTNNLIDAAMHYPVQHFITISTDKAVNPINVMGATKLLAERLTISANLFKGPRKTIFSCVRFGNVLNSRGSVIPLFRDQIMKGYVNITHPEMTRFFMLISEAVNLILKVPLLSIGGDVFILKMRSFRIEDLADAMINYSMKKRQLSSETITKQIIGIRKGEKMHEELISTHESERAYDLKKYIVIFDNIGEKEQKIILEGGYSKINYQVLDSADSRFLVDRQELDIFLENNPTLLENIELVR